MKIHPLQFVCSLFESLTLAVLIVLVGAIATAKAQTRLDVINELFTPTAAQRFLEAGRRDFEQQIDILVNPERYLNDDLLKFDDSVLEALHNLQSKADNPCNRDRAAPQLR